MSATEGKKERHEVGDGQSEKGMEAKYSRAHKKKRTSTKNSYATFCTTVKRKFIMLLEKCKGASTKWMQREWEKSKGKF